MACWSSLESALKAGGIDIVQNEADAPQGNASMMAASRVAGGWATLTHGFGSMVARKDWCSFVSGKNACDL